MAIIILESAKEIKRKVNIPVFLVGGMIDPDCMEAVIGEGDADYISLSRSLIIDPNFPKKIEDGSREPSKCIHCNLCITCVLTEPLRCHYGKRKTSNESVTVPGHGHL